MNTHEERYVVDRNGNRVGVVLEMKEYKKLIDDLEELESIRAFDQAKTSGETPVPFDQAVSEIERHQT
ncbi:MAG: hypothetical protein ACLQVL_19615 [Terriglobia bacterium]